MNLINLFDVDDIVRYLIQHTGSKSPLRIQKSLYFIYVYYQIDLDPLTDKELFNAEFEAWKSGPVIRSVFEKMNIGFYDDEKRDLDYLLNIESNPEIKNFLDEMILEMNKISEFRLLQLSKQDEVWKSTHSTEQINIISNEELVKEYKSRYA